MEIIDNNYIPEKILNKDWQQTYWKQHHILHENIYHLNTFICIIKKLTDFPFHLFTNFPQISDKLDMVWDYFFLGSYNSIIVTIFNLCIGQGTDLLNLHDFKKQINENIIEVSNRDKFRKILKTLDFKNNFKNFESWISKERNHNIGHLKKLSCLQDIEEKIKLRNKIGQNLIPIRNLINEYFHALSLGKKWTTTYQQYLDKTKTSDIENLLNLVAKKSILLNSPENELDKLITGKYYIPKEDLVIFNSYRKKFDLPEYNL